MKREFDIGDIAHLSNNRRLKGILNYDSDNENYKILNLFLNKELKIINYKKGDEKNCGGWIYNCEVEHKGITYVVEAVSQFDLIPKAMWEKYIEMEEKIKELEANK